MLEINPELNILLASGTPSINSMYKWVKKEWNLVNLLEKFTK
jgi:primosomal protein N'